MSLEAPHRECATLVSIYETIMRRSRTSLETPLTRATVVQGRGAGCFLGGRHVALVDAVLTETEDRSPSSRFTLRERLFL